VLTEPTNVMLLYTASLAGRLDLLPRLFTRVRQERVGHTGPALLIDLGRSCMPGTWICDVTDGRGMLVAMDAMGYDAFHIGPADPLYSQPATVQALRQAINTQFAAGPWASTVTRQGMIYRFAARLDVIPPHAEPADLTVTLQLGQYPRADVETDGERRLLAFDAGWTSLDPLLGRLDIALLPEPPYISVVSQAQLSISDTLMPDPTVSSIIEFVESEARYAEGKRGPV
jgi:hypothetical protein